jgi:tRNA U34 2-thiouridine synthase MnmA/TrmU
MLRRAAELMRQRGAAFCFTGEVLGQRPMSQRRGQLDIIERESGLEGRLLRPLSARLLPPTIVEEEGLVDRSRLLDVEGRTRKRQLAMAEEYGLKEYTSPAGGCLLTDREFAARLDDAFAHGDAAIGDIILLKLGRQYRLPSGAKAVVGRNREDNEHIMDQLAPGDAAFEILNAGSPVTLLRPGAREDWPIAAALTLRHSDARNRGGAQARVWTAAGDAGTIPARPDDAEGARRIGAPTK